MVGMARYTMVGMARYTMVGIPRVYHGRYTPSLPIPPWVHPPSHPSLLHITATPSAHSEAPLRREGALGSEKEKGLGAGLTSD